MGTGHTIEYICPDLLLRIGEFVECIVCGRENGTILHTYDDFHEYVVLTFRFAGNSKL